jgi:HK97 family phage major capsid protein
MSWLIAGRRYQTRADMSARVATLDKQFKGKRFDAASREEWNFLNEEIEASETDARRARVLELAKNPANCEAGTPFGDAPGTGTSRSTPGGEARDRALQTVERFTRSGTLTARAADRLDHHFRGNDPMNLDARYVATVGDPDYHSAFGKIVSDPTSGHLRHTPAETAALQAVNAVEAQRGLVAGTPALGGFAIPLSLDPSLLLTSSGTTNPIRDLARVITIASGTWQGVASEGVVATFAAEETEAADGTPALVGPTIKAETGRCFVPYSHELAEDWDGLADELARLMADAKDVVESQKFYDGSGTNEPGGIITGLAVGQRVQTAASNLFAPGDVWALKQAVGDRWKTSTTFLAHPDTLDVVYQMTAIADPSLALMMDGRGGDLLGRAKAEWSAMPAGGLTPADNVVLALAGSVADAFTICDRIGASFSVIPHLFGANRRPTGQSGGYFRWRVGAGVVNQAALRYLATTP